MMGLSDGERILMIRSAVLIQNTRVTDGRTDRQTDRIGVAYMRYSIYAVVRKNAMLKCSKMLCYITLKLLIKLVGHRNTQNITLGQKKMPTMQQYC